MTAAKADRTYSESREREPDMTIDRRTFLAGTAAVAALPGSLGASEYRFLTARAGETRIAPPEYPATRVWAFDGMSPGPELRVPQGGRFERRLVNELPEPTSVHWHGLRLDNAMDGVPDLTQAPVAPGATFDYAFDCPDAGTFWYHSHLKASEQVERGLYGAMIVDEPDAPDIDAEHVLILDDWRLDQEAQVMGGFDNGHDLSHAGRMGNVVTTNGAMDLSLDARRGDRLRLRLINAANARIFTLGLTGMRGWIVATDGMPVKAPRPVVGAFVLAPAQRLDLIVDIEADAGEEAVLMDIIGEDRFAQVTFRVASGGTPREHAPSPLPPNPSTDAPASGAARDLTMLMEGGAMRWLAEADSPSGRKSGQDLAGDGLFWALNGFAGRPDTPFATLDRGETVRLAFVNDTLWPHAMHIHGHHFFELDAAGQPGDLRDTTLVQPRETRSVLLRADNPGDWLLHCHMLDHHAGGMGTWVRVT